LESWELDYFRHFPCLRRYFGALDPPYDFDFEIRNAGCAPLIVGAVSLVFGTDLLLVSYPDSLGFCEADSISCQGYIYSSDAYFDSVLVAAHDSLGNHSGGFLIVVGTFQPELPDNVSTLAPATNSIVSSPSGSTQPEEQLFELRLVNRNGCPVRDFPSDLFLWSVDASCAFGDTSHITYEVLSPSSDEYGIVEAVVVHPEAPWGCSYSDCCEFTLFAEYPGVFKQETSGVKTADLNQDDTVNEQDQLILISNWGSDDFGSDLNGDGVVDFGDMAHYSEHYMETSSILGIRDVPADDHRVASIRPMPNPFTSFTDVVCSVPCGGAVVSLKIFDVKNREVRTLVDAMVGSGIHTARWDGFDDDGVPVASGVYFCRLAFGATSEPADL
jgi:hypothetical protein